jgi:hypothetical protein
MITPKEKALEIFTKMFAELFAEWHQIPYESVKAHIEIVGMELSDSYFMAKGSAMVAVNEIINSYNDEIKDEAPIYSKRIISYYNEVRAEIEKFGEVGFFAKNKHL